MFSWEVAQFGFISCILLLFFQVYNRAYKSVCMHVGVEVLQVLVIWLLIGEACDSPRYNSMYLHVQLCFFLQLL